MNSLVYYCDKCGNVIENHKDGVVIWSNSVPMYSEPTITHSGCANYEDCGLHINEDLEIFVKNGGHTRKNQ